MRGRILCLTQRRGDAEKEKLQKQRRNEKMNRGRYNSSKTRVCPAFRVIAENPEPFFELLREHFGLNINVNELKILEIAYSDPTHDKNEKPLNPNPLYLTWLLCHPGETNIGELKRKNKGELSRNEKKRLSLLCDGRCQDDGLKKIKRCENEGKYPKAWYILEGCTMPDVFIETNKFYMIIEGKRKEAGPKIGTTWYKKRHQMVRHLEGLVCYKHAKRDRKEANANKPTYGIFIVDGRVARKYKLERYIEDGPFRESLPHLKDKKEMYDEIKQSFLWCKHLPGYLTWRQIYDCYARQDGEKIKYLKRTNPDESYSSGEYELEEPRFEEL